MYRKSQAFELLDPAIKQEFELHVQLHQLALTSQQIGAGGNVIANAAPPVGQEGEQNFGGEAEAGNPQGEPPPA
jgi:hypothetical protein